MQSTEEEPENRDAGVTQSYMSNTSTLRPLQSSKQTSARAARRLSGTSQTSATTNSHGTSRPMIVSPRSSVTSPTRRPYSPPSAAAGQRPVSPPTRARSVMTTRGVASGPHVQQGLMEASAPKAEELAKFVALCRDCYYDKNAAAAQAIDATLARLSPQQKTAYARAMAGVRSQYHRDEENRRRELVEAAMTAHMPGQRIKTSLGVSAGGTIAMRSRAARRLRSQLLKTFILTHCDKSMPGTHPFFKGLYGALRVQSLPERLGGAGPRRVEWEVDVAVFSEAGGGSWMQDSIEALKAVLGCTEKVKESRPDSIFEAQADVESRSAVSPGLDPTTPLISVSSTSLDSPAPHMQQKRTPPAIPPHRGTLNKSARARATSDPFSDAAADGRTLVADGGPLSDDPPSPGLSSPATSPLLSDSSSPNSMSPTLLPSDTNVSAPLMNTASSSPPIAQLRIFSLPGYLTNPELRALCRLFPDFIAQASDAQRLKATSGLSSSKSQSSLKDAAVLPRHTGEAASLRTEYTADEEGGLRLGHGVVRFGSEMRDEGWNGTLLERFMYWLRALFGLA